MVKTAVIHITDKCNLQCPHCLWVLNRRTNLEMSMNDFKIIISYLKNKNYRRLMLQSEGEVLMHSRYREMFDYANCNKLYVNQLITNGLLVDKFASIIKLCRITVSLDGYTSECYKNHRGGTEGQFYKLIDNIKLLVRVPDRKRIIINYIITSENYKDIIKVIIFCEKLGVDLVRFHQYNPIINEYIKMDVNKDTLFHINTLLNKEDFNINIKFNLPSKYKYGHKCNQLINDRITIGLSGYVTPCCHIHSDEKYGTYDNPSNKIVEFKDKFNNSTKTSELPKECQKCPRLGISSINFSKNTHKWWYEKESNGIVKSIQKRRTG